MNMLPPYLKLALILPHDPHNIIQQITPVFQKVFNDTALTLLPEHSAADFDKWDSINHVILNSTY
jgi:hypothetical protein